MTNSTDPNANKQCVPFRRTSDKLVLAQLVGTIVTIVLGLFGFQWQISSLVANISTQLTRSEVEIRLLKESVAELKARLR